MLSSVWTSRRHRDTESKNDKRKTLGALGEQAAVDYLQKHGFRIRERNVRTRMGEIDIVAQESDALVFVEVRTRRGNTFGAPEESITPHKQQRLILLAEAYIQKCKESFQNYRIDVVVVGFSPSNAVRRVELIRNAVEG